MQYLASREEMQSIDKYSIESIGIPGIVLMEKAALAMEQELLRRYPAAGTVTVVVEKGNNGGDGLALARLLRNDGWTVKIYEIGGISHMSESYEIQRNILKRTGFSFCDSLPEQSDMWVDGIFGVGLKREVAGVHREVIEALNAKEGVKVAVDVPSGVDASTGQVLGCAFQADMTITFGLSKIGLTLFPGAGYAGQVVVKDIGFPQEAVQAIAPECFTYGREDLCRLPVRTPWSNKGTYGRVLLIAGTKNMAGAAYLTGAAAGKCGAGLVRIFTCEENRQILQTSLPEAILTTYASEEEALSLLPEALSWATVTGIGPGLGRSSFTERLLEETLRTGTTPLVVDADALNVLADLRKKQEEEIGELYASYGNKMIVTPHIKEMSRLTGKPVELIRNRLLETAREEADASHIYVLKDARTVVSRGGERTYINSSGNHGMARGGSGDVLTGIICGFLAGGLPADEAARLGVYCHGLAGDEAARTEGPYAMTARNLIGALGQVLR